MSARADAILSAEAVRSHCGQIMALAEQGSAPHFTLHMQQMPAAAAWVADTIRLQYPDLDVPYHSRWRHFEAGGIDRWGRLAMAQELGGAERARTRIDLVIPSVLLDAGAGAGWRYQDADGMALAVKLQNGGSLALVQHLFPPPCPSPARGGRSHDVTA